MRAYINLRPEDLSCTQMPKKKSSMGSPTSRDRRDPWCLIHITRPSLADHTDDTGRLHTPSTDLLYGRFVPIRPTSTCRGIPGASIDRR